MTTLAPCYRINHTDVVYDTFADETVIINLGSGNYFSVAAVAAEIWRCLEDACSLTGIVHHIEQRFDGDSEQMGVHIERFLHDLHDHGLLLADSSASTGSEIALSLAGVDRQPFTPPVLEVFDDMQGFLLVDPIHEVDQRGLPLRRTENVANLRKAA